MATNPTNTLTYGSPTAKNVSASSVSVYDKGMSGSTSSVTTTKYDKLYGSQTGLSPRTQQYVLAKLLTRSRENIIIDKFAQTIPIPKNTGKRIVARRYKNLPTKTSPLTEGVTPEANTLECEDVVAELKQYGGVMEITDQVQDFFDDPILNIMSELAGEQAADTAEELNWGIITSGTSVYYCGASGAAGSARSDVAGKITPAVLKQIERSLRRQNARRITSVLSASPKISTEPVPASYVILTHSDSKGMWEAMSGFLPVEKYASGAAINENEIGKVGAFRIILSNNFKMEVGTHDYGGTQGAIRRLTGGVASTLGTGSTVTSTTQWSQGDATGHKVADTSGGSSYQGEYCDVYFAVVLTKDCFALTPLAGMEAAKFYVVNPTATVYDPLAQHGTVGWKMYHAGMILNDAWMYRIEYALCNTDVYGA